MTRRIWETEHYDIADPILAAAHATIKKVGRKYKIQIEDPWVERLAKAASTDIKYQVMVQHLETKTDFQNIQKSQECDLSAMGSYYNRLSVCKLKDGQNLILRDNNEILV